MVNRDSGSAPPAGHRGRLRPLATLALLFLAVSASADDLHPCHVPGLAHEAMCGEVSRPLDPARTDGVHIDVHYLVFSAKARNKQTTPIFLLAGGPGQSAIGVAPALVGLFARLNNRRDIVFVDQRGTGHSAPLQCDDETRQSLARSAESSRDLADVARCREKLSKLPYGDLRFFTTSLAMQDLDAVRVALGAPQVDLVGESYGTRAALEYMRLYPKAVRRVVLDGVAPPDLDLSTSFAKDTDAALDSVFAACEAEPRCHADQPHLRQDWTRLLESLPKAVSAAHPLTGAVERFTLTREMVTGLVRGPLYAPWIAEALPTAISAAAMGRYEPLLGLGSVMESRPGTAVAQGMHFSVVCAEDLAVEKSAVAAAALDDVAVRYKRVCRDWPRGTVPKGFYRVPATTVPTLLLSGGLDPVLPPRHAARVAAQLGASALNVVVPNAGHNVLSVGCMHDVLFDFIDAANDAAALKIKTGCAHDVPRPPAFRPASLPPAKVAP